MRFLLTIFTIALLCSIGRSQFVTDTFTATTNEVNDGLNQTKPVTPWGLSHWTGGGTGAGTTYTNNSAIQGAGVIVGSGIGTNITLAQLPSAVVTNGGSYLNGEIHLLGSFDYRSIIYDDYGNAFKLGNDAVNYWDFIGGNPVRTDGGFIGDGSGLTSLQSANLVGLITTPQLVASNLVTYALTNLVPTNTAGITRQGNNQFAVSTNYDALGAATASTNGLPSKVWTLGNLSQSNYISGTSQTNVTFVASTFSGNGAGVTNLNAANITGNFWVQQSSGFFGYTNAAAIGSGAPGGGLRLVGNSADSRALIVATNYASLGSIALLTKGSLYFDTDNASSSYLFYVNGSLSTIIGSSLITLYKNVSCLSNLTATTITATNGIASYATNATASVCLNTSATAITNKLAVNVEVIFTVTAGTVGFFNSSGIYEGGLTAATTTIAKILKPNGIITNTSGTVTVNAAGAL